MKTLLQFLNIKSDVFVQMAIAESNLMAALLIGCETTLYIASRLQVYVELWHRLPVTATRNNLEESITMTYVHVLHFLAQAILVYEGSSTQRTISALWKINDVVEFEKKGNDLVSKIEIDASNCDRVVENRQQEIVLQLQKNMQKVLTELQQHRQLQASLDHLHVKIDQEQSGNQAQIRQLLEEAQRRSKYVIDHAP
jgi:hypothetical protein